MQSVVEITAHLQRSHRLTARHLFILPLTLSVIGVGVTTRVHVACLHIHTGSGTATVSRPTSEVKPIVVLPISILL